VGGGIVGDDGTLDRGSLVRLVGGDGMLIGPVELRSGFSDGGAGNVEEGGFAELELVPRGAGSVVVTGAE
jgi:hypothetical protein